MLIRVLLILLIGSTACDASDYSACLSRQATSPAELVEVIRSGTVMSNPKFSREHWVQAFACVGLPMTTGTMLDFVGSMKPREISTTTTALFVMFAKKGNGTLKATTTTTSGIPIVRRFKEKEWVLYSVPHCIGISSLRGLVFRWYPPRKEMLKFLSAKKRNKSKPKRFVTLESVAYEVGYLSLPLDNFVITQGVHGANGVDLAADHGTPVYAAAYGVVIESEVGWWNHGHGNCIVLRHGDKLKTVYAHLSENLVKVGQTVKQGELIGRVGNTGYTRGPTGNHLHFEVHGAKNPAV